MLPWLQRFRSIGWVDRALVRIEAYTALLEQYPWLKTPLKLLAGAVVTLWTWLGETWLPLALVGGVAAYLVLGHLSETQGTSGQSTPAAEPPAPPPLPQGDTMVATGTVRDPPPREASDRRAPRCGCLPPAQGPHHSVREDGRG